MSEQCEACERYEKRLKVLHESRTNLWRRGELTDATAKKLAADEQQLAEELENRVAQHGQSQVVKRAAPATDAHLNLEEEIRHRAYQLYEQRGREDGHDIDDWLSAEAEIIASAVKATERNLALPHTRRPPKRLCHFFRSRQRQVTHPRHTSLTPVPEQQ